MKKYANMDGCSCLWELLEDHDIKQLFRVRGTGADCLLGHSDDVELLIRVSKNPDPVFVPPPQEPPC